MIRVGADVGGTHTDLVMIDEEAGSIRVHKVPSTKDPSAGTVEALAELCRSSGVAAADIDYFMHGTTIATNIALEHTGACTGLITTAGFRDVLHIARHKRPLTFSLQLDLPWQSHPLVPRERRLVVPERIAASGEVIQPLDEDAARNAVRRLVASGVEAIAVCFLFSFLNPVHERRVGEIIAEEAPGVLVSLSHEVIPQYREYERFSTTALNAYIGPEDGELSRPAVQGFVRNRRYGGSAAHAVGGWRCNSRRRPSSAGDTLDVGSSRWAARRYFRWPAGRLRKRRHA